MDNAPIDIIQITTKTYRRLWAERFYLIHLGVLPFILASLNFVIVNVAYPDVSLLRRGLLMLPATLAEGWLVAQFLRTVLTGERWPILMPRPLPRPIPSAIFLRMRGILGGIILYVLSVVMMYGAIGGLLTVFPEMMNPKSTETQMPPQVLALSFAFLVFGIFQFRLFFLHVPMIVNVPFKSYLSATQRVITNVQMIGVWIAVQVPLLVGISLILRPFMMMGQGDGIVSFILFLIISALNVMGQMVLAVLGSTAIAFVIFGPLLQGQK
jgi:hypothetical protein